MSRIAQAAWLLAASILWLGCDRSGASRVERTEYSPPPQTADEALADDRLEEKNPPFDETVIDSRPVGEWELNASAAVIRLDCPAIKPDAEAELLTLRRSYSEAMFAGAVAGRHFDFLPSANLLDGAAKQFDDGLYAAVDLACYRGELGSAPAVPDVMRAIFDKQLPQSPARPLLAAALELAGRKLPLEPDEERAKQKLLAAFEANEPRSKPIGFYDWTPELARVWRFYRFLQEESDDAHLAPCRAVAAALAADPELLARYRAVNAFYGRLTNPLICLSADALIGTADDLGALAKRHGVRHPAVAVLPPSTSRETELFDDLFPTGLPAGVDLMATLIHRIRSGEVDLKPGEKDGWYQHQVYALETLLLPTRGQERDKLLLTASYKQRLVEAFKALITKRRETHVRQLKTTEKAEILGPPPLEHGQVRPRLRIEPCPTFYLRTARAYAFVQNLLLATAGKERLAALHGLKQGGTREASLTDELEAVRLRFYGFYLIACEDIGMKPQLLAGEPLDQIAAQAAALEWLKGLERDPDLACDTRVAVPIYIDLGTGKTRLWATLGVRLARLDAEYPRPPRVRPKGQGGPWKAVETYQLAPSQYVIPVDEFAEIELPGLRTLTRQELRAACDRYQTKEEIVKALMGDRSLSVAPRALLPWVGVLLAAGLLVALVVCWVRRPRGC
jgi:hypothetical protein